MILQPTIMLLKRPGTEYVLDAYINPFSQVCLNNLADK